VRKIPFFIISTVLHMGQRIWQALEASISKWVGNSHQKEFGEIVPFDAINQVRQDVALPDKIRRLSHLVLMEK